MISLGAEEIFVNYRTETVESLGEFEVYANRDSLPYRDLYGLKDCQSLMRGTYRYPGWCGMIRRMIELGLLKETSPEPGTTYREMMRSLSGAGSTDDVKEKTAAKLGLQPHDEEIKRLEWLGLFEDRAIGNRDHTLDALCRLMREKLVYKEGERDMILMRHRFLIENNDRTRDTITSTLIDYGIPGGDTSMARTVGLPLAIGVRLMAEGKINLTGIQIPNQKEIYQPVLQELEKLGIKLVETRSRVNEVT
jgi:saccharopine dehydrogenase-like NADP-dependent oxidoreductase